MANFYYLNTPDLRTSVGEDVPLQEMWEAVLGDRERIPSVQFEYEDAHGMRHRTFAEVPAPLTEGECDALLEALEESKIRHLTFEKTAYDLEQFLDQKFAHKTVVPGTVTPTLEQLHQGEG